MNIDQFVTALSQAADDFTWKLERQRWGDEDRQVLRAFDHEFKTCPIGAVCRHLGKGDYDAGGYVRSAAALGLSRRDRRTIAFAYDQSPMMDRTLRGRILAQLELS